MSNLPITTDQLQAIAGLIDRINSAEALRFQDPDGDAYEDVYAGRIELFVGDRLIGHAIHHGDDWWGFEPWVFPVFQASTSAGGES